MNQVVEINAQQRGGTRMVQRTSQPLAASEVRITMQAFSLNHRDLHIARGATGWDIPLPRIPLSDGVGIVAETGSAVKHLRIGDRVASLFWPHWQDGDFGSDKLGSLGGATYDGVLQASWQTQAQSVIKVPSYLTAAEAACLPCAALTAWTCLKQARAGEAILIHGSGVVSLFTVQFAKAMGLRITLTTRSPTKRADLEQLGVDTVHCYEGENWLESLNEPNFDLAVDTIGGATFVQSLSALRMGGTLVTLGQLGGGDCRLNTNIIWENSLTIKSAAVGSRADFECMNRALEVWRIHPVIANTRPWTEYESALDQLQLGQHIGKLVLGI